MLLVDDDEPDVGERRERRPAASRRRCRRRRARIRRHSSARSPSPRPEWTSATRASRSARSRSTSGRARAISGTSTSAGRPALERRGDRLDVDRGLAAAGHAVEQERASGRRRSIAVRIALDRLGLGGRQVRSPAAGRHAARPAGRRAAVAGARGPRPRPARAGRGRRSPRPHGAPPRSGRRRCPVGCAPRASPASQRARHLARTQRPAGRPLRRPRASRPPPGPRRVSRDPALVPRPAARAEQRPVRATIAPAASSARSRRSEPGPALGPGQVADRARTRRQLVEQVRVRPAAEARRAPIATRGASSATSSSRSSRPGGSIARRTSAGGAR